MNFSVAGNKFSITGCLPLTISNFELSSKKGLTYFFDNAKYEKLDNTSISLIILALFWIFSVCTIITSISS